MVLSVLDDAATAGRGRAGPQAGVLLTATWRYLVVIDFEVAPGAVESLVPRGTELDLRRGGARLSLVGFRSLRTRVAGMPVPFQDFERVSVRLCVTRRTREGEVRAGSAVVSEVVPRSALSVLDHDAGHAPCRAAPMRGEAPGALVQEPGRIRYCWRVDDGWYHIGATTRGAPRPPAKASDEAFVLERPWEYARDPNGATREQLVSRPSWRVWQTAGATRELDRAIFRRVPALALAQPTRAFVAEGSDVRVARPARIESR